MSERRFPIHPYSMRDEEWFPRSIPWSAAERFREQAELNHGQTLERLAERGGLSPIEIYLAYEGKKLSFGTFTLEANIAALTLVAKLTAPDREEKGSEMTVCRYCLKDIEKIDGIWADDKSAFCVVGNCLHDPSPKNIQSRTVLRRVAMQKGEPMPTFEPEAAVSEGKEEPRCPHCGSTKLESTGTRIYCDFCMQFSDKAEPAASPEGKEDDLDAWEWKQLAGMYAETHPLGCNCTSCVEYHNLLNSKPDKAQPPPAGMEPLPEIKDRDGWYDERNRLQYRLEQRELQLTALQRRLTTVDQLLEDDALQQSHDACVKACEEFRDSVLNQQGFSNDQINAILYGYDDTIGAALANAEKLRAAKNGL